MKSARAFGSQGLFARGTADTFPGHWRRSVILAAFGLVATIAALYVLKKFDRFEGEVSLLDESLFMAAAVIGGGLAPLLSLWAWNVLSAPCRQRDEARAWVLSRKESEPTLSLLVTPPTGNTLVQTLSSAEYHQIWTVDVTNMSGFPAREVRIEILEVTDESQLPIPLSVPRVILECETIFPGSTKTLDLVVFQVNGFKVAWPNKIKDPKKLANLSCLFIGDDVHARRVLVTIVAYADGFGEIEKGVLSLALDRSWSPSRPEQ